MEDSQFIMDSVVRNYHVYKDRWTPTVDGTLQCLREEENREDSFAAGMYKGPDIVGH